MDRWHGAIENGRSARVTNDAPANRYHSRCGFRRIVILLAFLAGLIAVAPPGLCPCWLIADVRTYHPHPDGQPDRPHTHDYLFELFHAQPVAALPGPPITIGDLMLALIGAGVWRHLSHRAWPAQGWATPPPTPPPRLAASC